MNTTDLCDQLVTITGSNIGLTVLLMIGYVVRKYLSTRQEKVDDVSKSVVNVNQSNIAS